MDQGIIVGDKVKLYGLRDFLNYISRILFQFVETRCQEIFKHRQRGHYSVCGGGDVSLT